MKFKTPGSFGFSLVEIMVVVAIIGLLAAMALPNFLETRTVARKNICINNLRQIDTALQQWALEAKKSGNASVSYNDISQYLKNVIICPAGGKTFTDSYTITTVSAGPLCNKVPVSHYLPWPSSDLATKPPPIDPGGATSGNGGPNPPKKPVPPKRPGPVN